MTALVTKPPPVEVVREPFAAYAARDRVNFSSLKEMLKSPAHYKWGLEHPRMDTSAFLLGRAVHTSVFEPKRFPLEYVVFTGDKRTKKWKEFQAANADKNILTADKYEHCLSISEAVRGRELPAKYLAEGQPEQVILWTDLQTGIKCKCRLDWHGPLAIVDLKTTIDPRPWAFERDAYKYHYCTQAAMYVDAVRVATGEDKPYIIIAVEKAAPHAVRVYEIPEESLDRGRAEYGRWLERLAGCREHDVWPFEDEDEVHELWEPQWVLNKLAFEDEDVGGLGLTTGGESI